MTKNECEPERNVSRENVYIRERGDREENENSGCRNKERERERERRGDRRRESDIDER